MNVRIGAGNCSARTESTVDIFLDLLNITHHANFSNPDGDRRLTNFLILQTLLGGSGFPRQGQVGIRWAFSRTAESVAGRGGQPARRLAQPPGVRRLTVRLGTGSCRNRHGEAIDILGDAIDILAERIRTAITNVAQSSVPRVLHRETSGARCTTTGTSTSCLTGLRDPGHTGT